MAKTMMYATAKAVVTLAIGRNVEAAVEYGRIRACSNGKEMHGGAFGNVQAIDLEILDGLPGHPGDRRADADHLLDRLSRQVRTAGQQRPLFGMFGKEGNGEA